MNKKTTKRPDLNWFATYLKELEVLDVLVFEIGLELDFLQGDRTGKEHVHELAVCGTCEK